VSPLTNALDGYVTLGQTRWAAWRRKQHLDDRLPSSFADVLEEIVAFAAPAINAATESREWDPHARRWNRLQL
jgi:hypothetical protein